MTTKIKTILRDRESEQKHGAKAERLRSSNSAAGWRRVRLDVGDGLSLIIDHRGKTPKKLGGDWSASGIPALSAKNIKNGQIVNLQDIRFVSQQMYERWMPEKLDKGDILLTSEAPLGEAYFLKERQEYCLSQRLFALRANHRVFVPQYLYYFLRSSRGQHELVQRISGTAAQGIRQAELRKVLITAPENLDEQKRIAGILSAFDDKIENNNHIIKTLEEMAQTLFKEWFVNFRFLGHENVEFVDWSLGRIPKGWEAGSFTKFIDVLGGGTPSTSNPFYWNGEIPFFTPKDAGDYFYVVSTEKNISEAGLEKCNSPLYPTNTVFITARGTVGKIVLAGVPMAMNQSCYALKGKVLLPIFVFLLTRSLIEDFKKQATGGVFNTITTDTFRRMEVVIPDSSTLELFQALFGSVFDQILNSLNENLKLAAMRDLLLPRLMSGEMHV